MCCASTLYTRQKVNTPKRRNRKRRRRKDSNGSSIRIYGNGSNAEDSNRFPKNALVDGFGPRLVTRNGKGKSKR